jgi:hypothetical protein
MFQQLSDSSSYDQAKSRHSGFRSSFLPNITYHIIWRRFEKSSLPWLPYIERGSPSYLQKYRPQI